MYYCISYDGEIKLTQSKLYVYTIYTSVYILRMKINHCIPGIVLFRKTKHTISSSRWSTLLYCSSGNLKIKMIS